MGLNMTISKIQFKDIGNQDVLRLDVGYRTFFDLLNSTTWDSEKYWYLSDILTQFSSGKICKSDDGILEQEEYLVDLANIIRRFDYLTNVTLVSEIGSDKNILQYGDIIIPKLQPRMGNVFTNPEHKRYIGSSELVEYKCNQNRVKVKFLFYLLTHPDFQNTLAYTESGKTHRRVSPNDLLKYKIPQISIDSQLRFIDEIKQIENTIIRTRRKIKSIHEIINNVFAKKFDIDFSTPDILQDEIIYKSDFEEIANEELKFDISLKYRNIFRNNIYNNPQIEWKPLGKIVIVKGGKRLPKGEDVTSEDTGFRYIRVDDLDAFGHFDIENIQFISKVNHLKIANYIAEKDDIILTIVGATVGKCGVLPEELHGENISENFARLIVKDKKQYSSLYLMYVLMSKIGQYQINEFKGRGSQGKLAIFRIKKIQIPDIAYCEQEEIIDKIHTEVQNQRKYMKKIEELRNSIDGIFNQYINQNNH